MDPVSLVVAALAAGAAAGATTTVSTAIADAYAGLKALVLRRFRGKPAPEAELGEIERGGDAEPFRQRLAAVGVDEESVRQATELLRQADPDGTRAGKYHVTITGGQGAVVGDNATVTMKFGE